MVPKTHTARTLIYQVALYLYGKFSHSNTGRGCTNIISDDIKVYSIRYINASAKPTPSSVPPRAISRIEYVRRSIILSALISAITIYIPLYLELLLSPTDLRLQFTHLTSLFTSLFS